MVKWFRSRHLSDKLLPFWSNNLTFSDNSGILHAPFVEKCNFHRVVIDQIVSVVFKSSDLIKIL